MHGVAEYKPPMRKDVYLSLSAGEVGEFATKLHEELLQIGYSLLHSDVLTAVLGEVQYYASWALLYAQRNAKHLIEIDEHLILEAFEWAIIQPVVLAKCDVKQAQMMESSRSLGGEQFGMSVSEAQNMYIQARQLLQRESFVEPPITLDIGIKY